MLACIDMEWVKSKQELWQGANYSFEIALGVKSLAKEAGDEQRGELFRCLLKVWELG